jgi:hypothetical protein
MAGGDQAARDRRAHRPGAYKADPHRGIVPDCAAIIGRRGMIGKHPAGSKL